MHWTISSLSLSPFVLSVSFCPLLLPLPCVVTGFSGCCFSTATGRGHFTLMSLGAETECLCPCLFLSLLLPVLLCCPFHLRSLPKSRVKTLQQEEDSADVFVLFWWPCLSPRTFHWPTVSTVHSVYSWVNHNVSWSAAQPTTLSTTFNIA